MATIRQLRRKSGQFEMSCIFGSLTVWVSGSLTRSIFFHFSRVVSWVASSETTARRMTSSTEFCRGVGLQARSVTVQRVLQLLDYWSKKCRVAGFSSLIGQWAQNDYTVQAKNTGFLQDFWMCKRLRVTLNWRDFLWIRSGPFKFLG